MLFFIVIEVKRSIPRKIGTMIESVLYSEKYIMDVREISK